MAVGDTLRTINGKEIHDVLDYQYDSYDARLVVELTDESGKRKRVTVKKEEGQDLGLTFETYLMDKAHACANRCVFCFVDQLPAGLRETLYFKDDDARLSFLTGNYITLTNLTPREIERIIKLRVSPINVSVHATDPVLRSMLLGSKRGGEGLDIIRRFAEAGIVMNCQIVVCPGLNDSEALERSMRDLAELYPQVNSVSIVPVGLTKHRDGLYPLKPFDDVLAGKTVDQVDTFGRACLESRGSRMMFCADELYIKAGRELPDDEYYEDYPQLENGVGMMRLLITEFQNALKETTFKSGEEFSVATGISAAKFLENLLCTAQAFCDKINGNIYAIRNDFFGETVDVAGLVTGGDLIRQLRGRPLGKRLLIPANMLRHGEDVFLDDVTVRDVSEQLGVQVRVVSQSGEDLARAMFGG